MKPATLPRLHIRRADLEDLISCGEGSAADIYVEYAPRTAFITHHDTYIPESALSAAVEKARSGAFASVVELCRKKHAELRKHPTSEFGDGCAGAYAEIVSYLREYSKAASPKGEGK